MIRRTVRFAVHAMAALVAASTIVVAVFAWRLSGGPVSLAFLTPYVQDALAQTDAPYEVEFSDTILTWAGWERALDIRILDVRAVGADGAVAATAPEVSISLSVAALWRGMIAPTAIEVIEPRVRLTRNADGGFEFGLGDDAGAAGGDASEWLIADLLAPPDPTRIMGYLERISIIRGDLRVVDQGLGLAWHVPRATVNLSRHESGIGVDATLLVDIAGRTPEIGVRARYQGRGSDFKVWVDFTDLRPEWFAAEASALAPLAAVRLPLSGTVELTLGPLGALRDVAFILGAGAGELVLDGLSSVPIPIAGAVATGTLSIADERLQLDSAMIDLGGPQVELEGVLEGFGGTPLIAVGVTISDLPIDDLARFWPDAIAPDARSWVVANISQGIIRKSQTTLHLRPGDLDLPRLPAAAVHTTFEVEDATVDFLNPLPKLTGVNAFGTITGESLVLRAWGGSLEGVGADEIRVRIDDLGGRDEMTVDVDASGGIRDVLRVLAHPFLGYPQKLGIEPDAVGGSVRVALHLAFPLLKDLLLDDVAITVDATLDDVRLAGVFDGAELTGGPLALSLDSKGLEVAGPIQLNAVPGAGAWRENFTDDAPFRRRYTFSGRFTDTQRLALGLPGGDYITGPTDVGIEIVDTADGERRWRITAGLADAMMRIPEIYWEKPVGVDGLFEIELHSGPGVPLAVDSFNLAAGDLMAHGRADLDPETGALRRLELDRLVFGENDLRAALAFDADGGYRIGLAGASLDLRPYFEDDDGTLPDLSLKADIERVITRDGQVLKGVAAALRLADDRWEVMRVDSMLGDGKRLAMRIGRSQGERFFWMESDDGGEVLRALGIFDDAIGGDLTILAAIDPDEAPGAVKGELKIRNFKVLNAPLLARILSVAAVTGVFDLLTGEGLPFSRLVVPFTKRGDVLEIEDARAFGPAVGFTFEGRVDLAAETVDLDGTIIPAYMLNSILGNIPILGDLLVGGEEGGGVFAMNYKMVGPIDDPETTVNPLSALAPGFLRGLFSADIDSVDDDSAPQPDIER